MDYSDSYKHVQEFNKKGDYDSAIKASNEMIRLDPEHGYGYFNRALAYANKGDFVRSISDYTDAIRLGLDNSTVAIAYYNRGVSYKKKGIYFKAIKDFEMANSLNPTDRETGEAIEQIRSEQLHHSDHEAARASMLDDEIKKMKIQQAIDDYTEELRNNPNLASAYYSRGIANKEREYYDTAIKDLEKAVELEPANDNYREALNKAKAAEQEAAELRKNKTSKRKQRKSNRRIIGGIIGAIVGGIIGIQAGGIAVIIALILGVVIGIIVSNFTSECITVYGGFFKGALIGCISFSLISFIISDSVSMGLLCGAIGCGIIGALSGTIFSNYQT